jgi:hypothetical protein
MASASTYNAVTGIFSCTAPTTTYANLAAIFAATAKGSSFVCRNGAAPK